MKRSLWILILVLASVSALVFPSCTRVGSAMNGSGKIIDQEIPVEDFNSLNVKGPFEVEVSQADSYSVMVSTDENLINRILVSLDHQTLKLSVEAPATFFPTSLKVKIAMPVITAINLSEKAKAVISEIKPETGFTLFMTGGSVLQGSLKGTDIIFNLSDASQVSLTGSATKLELESTGGSKLEMGDFALSRAVITLREASEATLNVDGRCDVILSDASKMYYLGNPLFFDTSITGGSSMIHK